MTKSQYITKLAESKNVKAVCRLSHSWAIETNNPDAEIFEVLPGEEGFEFFQAAGKGCAEIDTYIEVAAMAA